MGIKLKINAPDTPKTTEIVDRIINYTSTCEEMTVQQLKDFFGDRGFAIAIFIFSLPNALPIMFIPGTSTIFAIPAAIFAAQMMMGMPSLWLPRSIAKKYYPTQTKRKILLKTKHYLGYMEKVIKPRMVFMCGDTAERFIAAVILGLCLLVALPIPLGNMVPAIACCILALGLLEKDGLVVIIGLIAAVIGFALVFTIIYGLVIAGLALIGL